jgi:hypothetical protein
VIDVVAETVMIVLQVQETEIETEIVIDVVVETVMIVLKEIEIVIEIVVVATDAIFVDSGSNIKKVH